jgi:hypothetical protein
VLVLRGGSLLLEFALASLFGSFGFLCFRYLASFFECFLRVYLIVFSYAALTVLSEFQKLLGEFCIPPVESSK